MLNRKLKERLSHKLKIKKGNLDWSRLYETVNTSLKKNIYKHRHICFSDLECSTLKETFLSLNLSNALLYFPKYVFSLNEQICDHFVLKPGQNLSAMFSLVLVTWLIFLNGIYLSKVINNIGTTKISWGVKTHLKSLIIFLSLVISIKRAWIQIYGV